jgi:hypothetical protein
MIVRFALGGQSHVSEWGGRFVVPIPDIMVL